jgi:hypothetical protein
MKKTENHFPIKYDNGKLLIEKPTTSQIRLLNIRIVLFKNTYQNKMALK